MESCDCRFQRIAQMSGVDESDKHRMALHEDSPVDHYPGCPEQSSVLPAPTLPMVPILVLMVPIYNSEEQIPEVHEPAPPFGFNLN